MTTRDKGITLPTLSAFICVNDSPYAAKGDGTTDDTAAIQSALNSGNKSIKLKPGQTYIVSYSGTKVVSATSQRYCILVPDGVDFDLNGAILKQAAGSNASVLMLYSVTDTTVRSGTLDGNKTNQTTPATGEIANIYAYGCTRPSIYGVKAINCRMYAGRFLANTNSFFYNLICTDSDADGWNFGNSTYKNVEGFIDGIYAEACTAIYGGAFQGNGFVLTGTNMNVGRVTTKNCAGGAKVQDDASDINIASMIFIGGANGTVNSGVKIQGNGAGLQPKRVKISNVNVSNAYGNGLFVSDVISAEITNYHGVSNGTGAAAAGSDKHDIDINIPTGGRFSLEVADSESPAGQNGRVQGAGYVNVGKFTGKNPTGIGFSSGMTGELNVGDLRITDSAAGMTYAFRVTAGKWHVNSITTDKAHSTGQPRVTVDLNVYDGSIDRIRLGSTDVLEGMVQLTNGATSTTVANGHIWSEFKGVSDYFAPVIQLTPMETTARALGAMYAVPVDHATGTGFSIKHAVAGAGNYVAWKVLGWKLLPKNFV
jgi:hypothetical protein